MPRFSSGFSNSRQHQTEKLYYSLMHHLCWAAKFVCSLAALWHMSGCSHVRLSLWWRTANCVSQPASPSQHEQYTDQPMGMLS